MPLASSKISLGEAPTPKGRSEAPNIYMLPRENTSEGASQKVLDELDYLVCREECPMPMGGCEKDRLQAPIC